jgi:hypothetical protein
MKVANNGFDTLRAKTGRSQNRLSQWTFQRLIFYPDSAQRPKFLRVTKLTGLPVNILMPAPSSAGCVTHLVDGLARTVNSFTK